MSDVLDVITQLTYEANTDVFTEIDKAFGKQFSQIKSLEAEQKTLYELISKTGEKEIAQRAALNIALTKNKQQIDAITVSIGKEFAANEKLADSTVRATKNLSSLSFAGSQLLREAPAFTYSIQTGILALSNNIPILLDQLGNARKAGATTTEIFKSLGNSIFGLTGLLTIAVSVLTIFGDKIFNTGKQAKEAGEEIDQYAQFINKLKGINEATSRSIDEQIAAERKYIALLKDRNSSEETRLGAARELQKLFPTQLKDLTAQQILEQKNIDIIERQITAKEISGKLDKQRLEAKQQENGLIESQEKALKRVDAAEKLVAFTRDKQRFSSAQFRADALRNVNETLAARQAELRIAQTALTNNRELQRRANEESIRQAQIAGSALFDPERTKKEKVIDPVKVALEADRDLQELQKVKASIYDKYREFIRQDLLTGTVLSAQEQAAREKNLDTEVAIIDNFIAQRTNALKQSLSKSDADLLELKTEAAKLKKEYLDLIDVIASLPLAGSTGIVSPVFKERFNKNPIKDIQKDNEDATKQWLKNIQSITSAYVTLSETAIAALQQINDAQINNLDREIALREKSVENAEQLAERGNTEVLRLERERLEAATKEREEAAQRQIELNSLLQASNAAVALTDALLVVTNAGKTGDPYTTAARIAAAVAALAAGFTLVSSLVAASKATASGFKEGGYTGDGNVNDTAGVVHRKEFVMPAKITADKHNRKILDAMYKGEPLPIMKVPAHMGGFASKNELKETNKLLKNLITVSEDGKLKQSVHFDEHGVGIMTEKSKMREQGRWR